jgi:hypothetical protein
MTTTNSVTRWPEVGQYWAWRNPLSLVRIDQIDPMSTPDGVTTCTQWTPYAKDQLICFKFGGDLAEYLWFEKTFERPNDDGKWGFIPGDILLILHPPGIDRLIFIGPDTSKEHIHVIASWEYRDDRHICSAKKYQRGPGAKEPVGKTAYQHILEDDHS